MNIFGRITRRGLLSAAPAVAVAAATGPALAAIEPTPTAPSAPLVPPEWPPASPYLMQYFRIKEQHLGEILLYQMGNFFECFFEDARTVASVLDIFLTCRGVYQGEPIPMSGFPIYNPPFSEDGDGVLIHDYTSWCVGQLAGAGHRVALCYQVESDDQCHARGGSLVRREVLAVVDPVTGWHRV